MSKEKTAMKPLTMSINEMKAKIEAAIAESNLPACIIEPIICNYLLQLRAAGEALARAEKARYESQATKGEEEA